MSRGPAGLARDADEVPPVSRADFLRSALFGGGVLLLGGIPLLSRAPSIASAIQSPERDKEILNFALLLEYLEDGFYRAARDGGALSGELLRFAEEVGRHEASHVELLRAALGADARSRPTFEFGDATSDPEHFSSAALLLEETGTAAYIGQGANLSSGMAETAGRIASVEARHTAWIRDIAGRPPAPHAADPAMTRQEVFAAIRNSGFLS
jgi:Ferritin-like domain